METMKKRRLSYLPLGDGVEQLKIRQAKDKISNKAFHHDVCRCVWMCVSA